MKEYKYIGLLLAFAVVSLFSFIACSDDDEYDGPVQVETANLKNVGYDRAECGGNIISGKAKEYGICWSTSAMPTIEASKTTEGSGSGEFTGVLTGLTEGTVYYVRAWAKSGSGEVVYGEQKQCVTMAYGKPVTHINEIKQIKETTAVIVSQMLVDGGVEVSEFGIVYGLTEDVNLEKGNVVKNNLVKKEVEVPLHDLIDNTTYYVVAYAKYKSGVVYSSVTSFQTLKYADPVISLEIGDISGDSFEATLKAVAGSPLAILEYGMVYGKATEPTLEEDMSKKAGEGEGTGKVRADDLDEDTRYYVRSYAKDKNGVSYGSETTVLTLSNKALVSTVATARVTAHRAFVGGEVLSLGLKNAPLIEAGICWSTAEAPTLADNHIKSDITDAGMFAALELFCLKPATRYYVRAYATNQYGTNYGEEVTFITREPVSDFFKATYTGSEFNSFYMGSESPGIFSEDQTAVFEALAAAIKATSSGRVLTGIRYVLAPDATGNARYLISFAHYTSGGKNYVGTWKSKLDKDESGIYSCSHFIVDAVLNGNSTNIEKAAITKKVYEDLYQALAIGSEESFVVDWDTETSGSAKGDAFRIIPVQSPQKYRRMEVDSYSLSKYTYTDWW